MSELDEVRKKINQIDKDMAKLFEERMKACYQVAMYKKKYALPIYDANREIDVVNKNSSYIEDDEIRNDYINFIKYNMSLSRNYQRRLLDGMKISYSGIEGAFAHIATMKMFPNAKYISYHNFEEAYKAVESGECDSCVLPLENSYAGEVGHVMDLIFSGSLYINHVIELDVTHNLIGKKDANLNDIKTVISHQQALNQCSKYINKHNYNIIETSNTAIAAKNVSDSSDISIAAIASKDTAKLYNLKVLDKNINTNNNNTTRFGVFARSLNSHTSKGIMGEHFILVFTVTNEAGSLAKMLNIIGSHGFNMRTLRSRPMKELIWNYYFYIELEGNINSIEGKEMLKELEIFCDRLKLVGTYYSHVDR